MINDPYEIIERLTAENISLKAKIAELEHRLGLNSRNSSKPPSSDGLRKDNAAPLPKSQLKRRNKNKAARNARKNQNNLTPVEKPDHIVEHRASACQHCHTTLVGVPSDAHEKRQVFDMPKPKFHVTEHQIHRTTCPCCARKNHGTAPKHVRAHTQYGPNFGAFCVYLNSKQLIPYHRISELAYELFGRKVSEQVILNFIHRFKTICDSVMPVIDEKVRSGAVKHADETGVRVAGSLHWLFVTSSGPWTKYWVSKRRGHVMRGMTGILSRDGFAPYDTYNPDAEMALCNAHILRELEAIRTMKAHEWAGGMQKILCLMEDLKTRYASTRQGMPPRLRELAITRYDRLIFNSFKRFCVPPDGKKQIKTPLEKKASALINRLITRKWDVLRFFINPIAPFTNNVAERNVRMSKVQQKISGCFRTLEGAHIAASIRSVLVTLGKQGTNLIHTMTTAFQCGTITFADA